MIHPRTLHALEYDRVQSRLADLCQSECGRARALALVPLASEFEVAETQKLFDESLTFASRPGSGSAFAPGAFPDVTPFLAAVRERGAARAGCDLDALFALRALLLTATQARDAICVEAGQKQWPRLMALATNPPLPAALTQALTRCLNDDGQLRDEASPELFQVRVELRGLHQTAMRRTRSFAEKYNILGYLQDEFMTLSSDRYVLPFKANYKNKMQGILHDWSQTGETCYFEPMFLVDLNNRIQELKREEREEERKVLLFLAGLLGNSLPGAQAAVRLLTELDLLQAKQRLADLCQARVVPLTPVSEGLMLSSARHPLLLLAERSTDSKRSGSLKNALSRVRPVDIVFRPGDRAVIVTGGNAGGKTVCLKTLGLCVAMALAGLPVPVDKGSHLPWITRMDAFIGDEQSLEDNVSTFTAQIEHLAKAWKHLDSSGLVLLDEFGSGTDPSQGAALAQAVLDELLAKGTFVLTATHFPALKGYALAKEGARAASMLFDPEKRTPLYVLAYDQVGSSQALDVAREYGLPECVIRRAEHYLLQDGEDTAAVLRKLNELALKREEEIARLKDEQNKAANEARHSRERLEAERRRLEEEVRRKSQELMRAVKEEKITRKQALKQMAAVRASLAAPEKEAPAPEPALARPLIPGDTVTHTVFRRKGVVTDVDARRGRVRLDMGGVSLWADMNVLEGLPQPAKPAAAPAPGRVGAIPGAAQARSQASSQAAQAAWSVDVRGMRAEEAVHRLQGFLDKAWLADLREVEVIHGRGTGALRRAIHEWLAACPRVAMHQLAPADRGGDGMTIVTLKD